MARVPALGDESDRCRWQIKGAGGSAAKQSNEHGSGQCDNFARGRAKQNRAKSQNCNRIISRCNSVWLECLLWEQDAAGSSPVTSTIRHGFKTVSFLIQSARSKIQPHWRFNSREVVDCYSFVFCLPMGSSPS